MKITMRNLEANPYRRMKQYPIDKAKVESLKTSIKETSFWDNILARPHPKKKGFYQIAYGHHRLVALQELGYKEVNIPVRDLTDARMVKIMAEENLNWTQAPAIMIQTIDVVRKFLNAELAKCKTYKELGRVNLPDLFKSEPEFRSVSGKGAGKETIAKFLGGNWNEAKVRGALEILDDVKLDKAVVKTFPSMYQTGEFRKAVNDYSVPKADQKKIAEKIVKDEVKGRSIRSEVYRQVTKKKAPVDPELAELEKMVEQINKQAQALDNKISGFQMRLKEYGVTTLGGKKMLIALLQLQELSETISILFNANKPKQIKGDVS